MPSCEEYRERARRARREAKVCRDEWERQGLLAIADQLDRIASYKELTSVRPDNLAPDGIVVTSIEDLSSRA